MEEQRPVRESYDNHKHYHTPDNPNYHMAVPLKPIDKAGNKTLERAKVNRKQSNTNHVQFIQPKNWEKVMSPSKTLKLKFISTCPSFDP